MSDICKKFGTLTHERDNYREQFQRLDHEVLRLQEELGEVRQELRLAEEVFAGSVEGTIITDAEFCVLRVNPAFTRITSCQPHEVVGRKLSWLDDVDFAREVLVSLDEQDHWRGEHRDITKSGADYVSWLNISSVKNARGKVTDYIVAFLDITEGKSREEENDRYLEELNAAYRRFVPQRFLEYLEKPSIIDIELGNHVEPSMKVLFSDIIDFTKLSESMSPTENFRFIDKYIGDAVMALFDGKADDAVRAAIAMLRILISYNEGRGRAGYKPVKISIGVNSGTLMSSPPEYRGKTAVDPCRYCRCLCRVSHFLYAGMS